MLTWEGNGASLCALFNRAVGEETLWKNAQEAKELNQFKSGFIALVG